MKTNKVKSINLMGGMPSNIYDDWVDVFVTLEDDDAQYWVEVTTPQALFSYMDKKNQKFLEPLYPFIIVRELTPAVI